MANRYSLLAAAKNRGKKRPPLRNLSELADEFGVTHAALLGIMKNAAGRGTHKPPEPFRSITGATVGAHNYYDRQAMHDWWARVRETKA